MPDERIELPSVTAGLDPRFVLDTGRRCTICLAPLFGDPGLVTVNKSIEPIPGSTVTLSFPVCTVCVDVAPPHTLRLERWKIARPGRDMSLDVFGQREVVRELLFSGVESYYSRAD
jgi:hypothetical protein